MKLDHEENLLCIGIRCCSLVNQMICSAQNVMEHNKQTIKMIEQEQEQKCFLPSSPLCSTLVPILWIYGEPGFQLVMLNARWIYNETAVICERIWDKT